MKKRLISALLCTAMVASMLAGCGGETVSSGGGADEEEYEAGSAEDFDWKNYEGTTINVMFNEHNYSKAVIEKIPEFEELTGITVEYSSTPESNYFDKLNTSLSSRSGTPDVYMTGAYQVWEYAPAGYMEPLDNYINDPAKTDPDYNFDDFIPAVVDGLKWDTVPGHKVGEGSQWALPMGWELNCLAYNKNVFAEKGLEVPTTTDELLETATALNEFAGSGSYGIAVRGTREWATIHPGYMSLFSTWGAQDFAIEDGKLVCQLDSEEAIAMTDYWVNLIKAAGPPQWTNYTWYEASADLGAGKAAMLFDATSAGYFQNAAVSSMLPYGILAVVLLALAIVLAQLKLTGGAAAAAELVSGAMRIAAPVLLTLCLINLIAARAEGLGYIYFSNADVTLEVQTPENLSSATGTIANMICLAVSAVVAMAAAFFRLTKKEA